MDSNYFLPVALQSPATRRELRPRAESYPLHFRRNNFCNVALNRAGTRRKLPRTTFGAIISQTSPPSAMPRTLPKSYKTPAVWALRGPPAKFPLAGVPLANLAGGPLPHRNKTPEERALRGPPAKKRLPPGHFCGRPPGRRIKHPGSGR